jgi:HAMP domain-containing protein
MAEITERPKRTVFISSRVRLLIGFTLLFSVVFAGAFYWFYVYSTNVAINRLEQEVLDMVKGTAEGVDVDQFVALAKEGVVRADGYTDDPRYWAHVDWLVRVSRTNPNAQVYSYVAGTKPKEVIFIGSVGALNTSPGGDPPPWGAKFQEHYTSSGKGSANLLTGLDHLGAKTTIYEDKWGSWMSGYGPIVNAKGEKVGAIGVDISADYVKEVQQGIVNRLVVAFAITYIILFALVYAISTLFTRPIVALTYAAGRIGDGDYDQDLSNLTKSPLRDEMSSLAGVFQIMVDKVHQREKNLRARVAQLEIMIDRSKLETQVKEIVDSDFFQDLRAKVQDMRSRFKDEPTADKDQKK